MLRDKDPERARRVMTAMLPMVKLDVRALKDAYKAKDAGGQDSERPQAGKRSKRDHG